MSRDPVGYEGGINLYGYAGNNPLNYSDPFGLINCDDCEQRRNDCISRALNFVKDCIVNTCGQHGGVTAEAVACAIAKSFCTKGNMASCIIWRGCIAKGIIVGRCMDSCGQMGVTWTTSCEEAYNRCNK